MPKKRLGKIGRTARGFELVEFHDCNGDACSLQQSSSLSVNAIWLGCEKETVHPQTKEPCGARMHLTRDQVKALIPLLQNWVCTGSFKTPTKMAPRIATKR